MFKRQKVSTNLIQSIRERNWLGAYQYLNEASVPESDNSYALHEICSDSQAPIKLVQDIYHAHPKAILTNDDDDHTPLYIAVEAAFEDAVEFLVKSSPDPEVNCRSLLSALYSLKCTNVIDLILSANPQAAFIPDPNGDTAFDMFFRIWNAFIRIVVHNSTIIHDVLEDEICGNWKVRDVYQKAFLFLNVLTFHRKGKTLDDGCLLHCAVREESCHWAFCKLIMELHPEQVLNRDVDGNLPIHILAAAKNSSDEESFLCLDCFMNKSKLVNFERLNGDTCYCCEDCFECEPKNLISKSFYISPVHKVHGMVKELISIAPQMMFIADGTGNYPLHIAIHNQQEYEVMCELFGAFPAMSKIQDQKTRLLPFMLAAVDNWESEEDQLSVIYHLLQEDPHSIFEFKTNSCVYCTKQGI